MRKIPLTGDHEVDDAIAALQAARDYQQAWLDHGVNRVYLYFEGVDGDWLEKFCEDDNGN